MRPWLVLPIGLGLAVAAAWVLLTDAPSQENSVARPPLQDEIREESRDKLREILREADEAP